MITVNRAKKVAVLHVFYIQSNSLDRMNHKKINRQQLVWASPSRKSGRKVAGKTEGFHLPNSVTEDVSGFSLMPHYSAKQQRSMGRRQRANQERRMNAKW